MTDGDRLDSGFALNATVLATVIGSIVVLVLLLWPMSVPMGGYHDGWYPGAAGRERCERVRAGRFARAGDVATVTAGVVALFFVYRWTRRRLYATDVPA